MKNNCYYNGRFSLLEETTVPVLDRAFFFGDAVYEVVFARNHVLFAWDDHFNRLCRSLEKMEIPWKMNSEELAGIVQTLIDAVDTPEQWLYIQVSRGTYARQHAYPPEGVKSNLFAYARPNNRPDTKIAQQLITMPDNRWGRCDIKTTNLIPNIMATQKAKEAGCAECVFHRNGIVTECASSSIFIIQDGVLRTAPNSEQILPGTARAQFIRIAKKLGIPVREEAFTVEEMFSADEVFYTGTSKHGIRVDMIDGIAVGGKAGCILEALQTAYREWLESVCGTIN